jgi:hypothetical protein
VFPTCLVTTTLIFSRFWLIVLRLVTVIFLDYDFWVRTWSYGFLSLTITDYDVVGCSMHFNVEKLLRYSKNSVFWQLYGLSLAVHKFRKKFIAFVFTFCPVRLISWLLFLFVYLGKVETECCVNGVYVRFSCLSPRPWWVVDVGSCSWDGYESPYPLPSFSILEFCGILYLARWPLSPPYLKNWTYISVNGLRVNGIGWMVSTTPCRLVRNSHQISVSYIGFLFGAILWIFFRVFVLGGC